MPRGQVACDQQKSVSQSPAGWKSAIGVLAQSGSGEGLLPGYDCHLPRVLTVAESREGRELFSDSSKGRKFAHMRASPS